jgi:hypothetical protein
MWCLCLIHIKMIKISAVAKIMPLYFRLMTRGIYNWKLLFTNTANISVEITIIIYNHIYTSNANLCILLLKKHVKRVMQKCRNLPRIGRVKNCSYGNYFIHQVKHWKMKLKWQYHEKIIFPTMYVLGWRRVFIITNMSLRIILFS